MMRLSAMAIVVVTLGGCMFEDTPEETPAPGSSSPAVNGGGGGAGATKPADPAKPGDTAKPADSVPSVETKPGDKPVDKPKVFTKLGTISLTQVTIKPADANVYTYSTMASFVDVTGAVVVNPDATTAKCTQSTEGDCEISACDMPRPKETKPVDPPVEPKPVEPKKSPTAGDIKVTALEKITLSPDDKLGFYAPKTGDALFKVDTKIGIKAEGAEIPAFEKELTGPSLITITSPKFPTTVGSNLKVDKSKDFVLKWSNGTTGNVETSVMATAMDDTTITTATITCRFKASAGTGTITKAALDKAPKSTAAMLSVSVKSQEVFEVGDWQITAMAMRPAKVNNNLVPGMMTLE